MFLGKFENHNQNKVFDSRTPWVILAALFFILKRLFSAKKLKKEDRLFIFKNNSTNKAATKNLINKGIQRYFPSLSMNIKIGISCSIVIPATPQREGVEHLSFFYSSNYLKSITYKNNNSKIETISLIILKNKKESVGNRTP